MMLAFKITTCISVLFVCCYSVPTGIVSEISGINRLNNGLKEIALKLDLDADASEKVAHHGAIRTAGVKQEQKLEDSGRLVDHKEVHGHHEGDASRRGDQIHKNDYAEGEGHRKQYHDSDSNAKKFLEGQAKLNFGQFAEKNDHKKGQQEVGYKYKFNKDEFKNHDEFFDNYREGGYHNTYGEAYGNFSAKEANKKHGGSRKEGQEVSKHGQKKKVDKGKKSKSSKTHKRRKGQDTNKNRLRQYGQKRGKQKTRRYGYGRKKKQQKQ